MPTADSLRSFRLYLYGPDTGALPTSFEQAAERLEQQPRLYFELDGSFVWSLSAKEQIFGMLYDANGSLQYVELQGLCRRETWREVVSLVTGDCSDRCVVMLIPSRELKDLHSFEKSTWD